MINLKFYIYKFYMNQEIIIIKIITLINQNYIYKKPN